MENDLICYKKNLATMKVIKVCFRVHSAATIEDIGMFPDDSVVIGFSYTFFARRLQFRVRISDC